MEDDESSRGRQGTVDARDPRLGWTLILLIVGSVLLVRGHDSAWPLIGWTMYWRVGEVPDTLRTVRVDVVDADGKRHSFFPTDPLTHVERPLIETVMWQAFSSSGSEDAARRFMVRLLERKVTGVGLSSINGFMLEWDVPRPPELRYIDRDDPDREISIGDFNVEAYR